MGAETGAKHGTKVTTATGVQVWPAVATLPPQVR